MLDRLARLTALALAPAPAGPRPPLPADEAEWRRLLRMADRHHMTPLLARALAACGDAVEPELLAVLGELAAGNAARNRRLRAALVETAGRLNALGLEPVLLKGAVRLVDGLYPALGDRVIRDLDLLLPKDAAAAAQDCLLRAGYRQTAKEQVMPWHEHHHLPALRHPESGAWIELHFDLSFDHHRGLLRPEGLIARSARLRTDGVALRLPDPADQLAHLALHGVLHHGGILTGDIRLRELVEAQLLLRRGGPGLAAQAALRLERRRWIVPLVTGLAAHHLGPLPGLPSPAWTRPLAAVHGALQGRPRAARVAERVGYQLDRVHRGLLSPDARRRLRRGLASTAFYLRQLRHAQDVLAALRR